jgi:hypothetical protein
MKPHALMLIAWTTLACQGSPITTGQMAITEDPMALDSGAGREPSSATEEVITKAAELFLVGHPELADSLTAADQDRVVELAMHVLAPQDGEDLVPWLDAVADRHGVVRVLSMVERADLDAQSRTKATVATPCGGYVPYSSYNTEPVEQSDAGGYSQYPNCAMPAPEVRAFVTHCGTDVFRDDMLSHFMGWNTDIGGYRFGLRYWHSSSIARRALGTLTARVYNFAWQFDGPRDNWNTYTCIPWQLRSYESGIRMTKL